MPRTSEEFETLPRGHGRHLRRWEEGDEPECWNEEKRDLEEEKVPDWAVSLQQGLVQLSGKLEARQRQNIILGTLTARVAALEERAKQPAYGSLIVPVSTLDPAPFELLKEIKVVVQQVDEDEFVATYFDGNINASGFNEVNAVDALKEVLVSRFVFLGGQPPVKLGKLPTKQLGVLRTILRRRP